MCLNLLNLEYSSKKLLRQRTFAKFGMLRRINASFRTSMGKKQFVTHNRLNNIQNDAERKE